MDIKRIMIIFSGLLLLNAFAQIDNAGMEKKANQVWDHAVKTWRSPRTGLFYGKKLSELPKAKEYPTPEQYRKGQYTARGVKKNGKWVVWNIAGGGTGTEDCGLFNGPMLGAICDKYIVTKDPICKEQAQMAYQGCISLATAHGEKGFIARGVCHEDGKSIFPETSRDQYTNVMWGLWRYYHSELSTEKERKEIRQIFTDIAEKMIREVTPENDWCFLYPYGVKGYKVGDNAINVMYNRKTKKPDAVLTMMYGVAYDVTGNGKYYKLFEQAVPDLITQMESAPEVVRKKKYIVPTYTVNQTGYKWRMIYEIVKAPAQKSALLEVFKKYMDFCNTYYVGNALGRFRGPGEVYHGMLCCPGYKLTEDQLESFRNDFEKIGGWAGSVYTMLPTYWAARVNGYYKPGEDKKPVNKAGKFYYKFNDTVNAFYMEPRWSREGGNKLGKIETVPAEDHALGGNAVKISHTEMLKKFDRFRISSRTMIMEPGRKYRVSGWFKADRDGVAQMQMSSLYDGKRKQWWVPKNFAVTAEWKRIVIDYDVPAADPKSTVSDKKFYLIFGLFQNKLTALWVKGLVWEEL